MSDQGEHEEPTGSLETPQSTPAQQWPSPSSVGPVPPAYGMAQPGWGGDPSHAGHSADEPAPSDGNPPQSGWNPPQSGWNPPQQGWSPPQPPPQPPSSHWTAYDPAQPGWGLPQPLSSEQWNASRPTRTRRAPLLAAAALLLVLAATAAGVGVGHAIWPGSQAAAQGSNSSGSNSSGSIGSGSSGTNSGGSGSSSGGSPFSSGPGSFFGQSPFGSGTSSNGGSAPEGSGGPSDVSSIASKVDPALVDVNSTFSYQQAQGAGTGIVLTSNGEVLTNNHVVDGATKISVTDVGNGRTYNATVVGYDSTHDIAVLQLQDASGLTTASFANSSKLAVGESIVAIGNAGGAGGTPTSAGGSITGLNQSITAADDLDGTSENLSGLIQVNADVQAGDSGGSLVNDSGQVVGMDTAGSSGTTFTDSATQGFAIPINEALATASAIEAGQGSSTIHVGATAFLGVLISSQNAGSSTSGAVLGGVVSGGPAAAAGLSSGDTITSFDGESVTSASTISRILVGLHPGDKVQLTWVDSSGQSHSATVQLASGPPA